MHFRGKTNETLKTFTITPSNLNCAIVLSLIPLVEVVVAMLTLVRHISATNRCRAFDVDSALYVLCGEDEKLPNVPRHCIDHYYRHF